MLGADWAELGGVEFANTERVYSYLLAGYGPPRLAVHGAGCSIASLLGDAPYTTPSGDNAPWYDPVIPESADFAGLLVTNVAGGEDTPYQRSTYGNIAGGTVLGRLRPRGKALVYSGVLVGRTCCAVAYGLRWLTAVLVAGDRCNPCVGSDLEVITACPPADTEPCLGTSLATPASVFRTLKGVGLIDGPNLVGRGGGSCPCGCTETTEVTFTLAASSPFLWAPAITFLDHEPFPVPDGCVIDWVKVPDGTICESLEPPVCEEDLPCGSDPFCSPPPALPTYASGVDPCDCDPLDTAQLCQPIPLATTFGRYFDGVPIIEVYSGSAALRNVTVDLYEPEDGVFGEEDCTTIATDPCLRDQRIRIRYVPAHSTLRIDGTTRRITLSCAGGAPVPGDANLSGSFSWPELACTDTCICISADLLTVAADATATLLVVPREAAPAMVP